MRRAALIAPALTLLATALAPGAASQEPRRGLAPQRLAVTLRNAKGQPWVGAKLHLYATPGVDAMVAGKTWQRSVECGARGRVRVELPTRAPFMAWAIEELKDGRYRTSQLLQNQRGDTPLQLRAGPLRSRLRVRIQGLKAWQDEAPMSVYVHIGAGIPQKTRLVMDKDGNCELPPFPGTHCQLRVHGKSGLLLLAQDIEAQQSQAQKTEQHQSSKVLALQLLAPRHMRILIQASSQDREIQDLVVEAGASPNLFPSPLAWRPIPFTRNGQQIDLRLPLSNAQSKRCSLRIRAKNYGWYYYLLSGARLPTEPLPKQSPPRLRVHLQPETIMRGKVLIDAQTPAAGAQLLVLDTDIRRTQVLEVDAKGRFELRNIEARRAQRFVLWLSDAQRLRFSESARQLVEPLAILHVARGTQKGQELPDLRLDQLVRLSLRVFSADGRPARHAQVAISEHIKLSGIYRPLFFETDRRGRVDLLVPRLSSIEIGAAYGASAAGSQISTEKLGEAGTAELSISLPRSLRIRGQVVDSKGRALAGARVYASPLARDAIPYSRLLRHLSKNISTSDARGYFDIPLPSPNHRYLVIATLQHGKRALRSAPVQLEVEGKSIDDVKLSIPTPPTAAKKAKAKN
ncbi:MAG: hypothetical protein CSA62_10045 [Planctomycetota bacterium]|nr:MAG: hypothetical protein CSA62_10045 [Planctomycetota bacterium]